MTNTDDSILPAGPLAGQVVKSKSERDLGSAKLTWKLSDSQSLIGTFFQDPRDDTGAINDAQHTLNGDPLTYQGVRSFGGKDYSLRYEGILSTAWLLAAQVARHREENSVGPASAPATRSSSASGRDFFQTGGFGLLQEKDFQRDFAGGSATRYLERHEIKLGLEYEREQADVVRRYSGGQQMDVFANGGRPVYSHFYWTTPTATPENAPVSQLTASPEHKNTTAYLQDRWTAAPASASTSACAGTASRSSTPRGPGRSTSRRTSRRASASSGTPRPAAVRRSSAPAAATTSRSRWTW